MNTKTIRTGTKTAPHPGCPVCNRIITKYPKTGVLRPHNTGGKGTPPCRGAGRTPAVLLMEIEDQRRRDQEHAATHWPNGADVTAIDPKTGDTRQARLTWDGQGYMSLDLNPQTTTEIPPMAARLLDAALVVTSQAGHVDIAAAMAHLGDRFWEDMSLKLDTIDNTTTAGPTAGYSPLSPMALRLIDAAQASADARGESVANAVATRGEQFWESVATAMTLDDAPQGTDGEAPHSLSELAQWWRNLCQQQIDVVVPKALEYSSTDLRDLGRQLSELAGHRTVTTQQATELGIAFYAAGKIARIMGAVKEGRMGSYDSWLDLAIYATMAMRVHQTGAWPGTPADDTPDGWDPSGA